MLGIRAALYPNSVVKTHLQVSEEQGILQTYKNIFRRDGLRGLWRGFWTLSIGIVPGQAVYLSTLVCLFVTVIYICVCICVRLFIWGEGGIFLLTYHF